jgi:hypothetical protein
MIKTFSHRSMTSIVTLLLLLLSGCATTIRNAVPVGHADGVEVSGIGRVRGWGDVEIPNYQQLARARLERIKQRRPALLANRKTAMNSLAISGGAADGAFGAGFFKRLDRRGDTAEV